MDAISLPLLSNQDTVHLALACLKSRERAGVVVDDGSQFHLLHAGDLLAAREACKKFLSEVGGSELVYVVGPADATAHGLDLVRPLLTQAEYQNMFTRIACQLALVGADHDTAMIVTRSEDYERTLRGTGGYECNGMPKHFFPRPRVKAGDRCPLPYSAGVISPAP